MSTITVHHSDKNIVPRETKSIEQRNYETVSFIDYWTFTTERAKEINLYDDKTVAIWKIKYKNLN